MIRQVGRGFLFSSLLRHIIFEDPCDFFEGWSPITYNYQFYLESDFIQTHP